MFFVGRISIICS